VEVDPISLLKSVPTRSSFRHAGSKSKGSRVRFKVADVIIRRRPKWLPVIRAQTYKNKQMESNHAGFTEALVPKVIPRKRPPVPIPFKPSPKLLEKDLRSKSRSCGKLFSKKVRSPPPKAKLNVATTDVKQHVFKKAAVDSSSASEPKHLDVEETHILLTRSSSTASAGKVVDNSMVMPKSEGPRAKKQKLAPSSVIRPKHTPPVAPISRRRSRRLSRIHLKKDVDKDKE